MTNTQQFTSKLNNAPLYEDEEYLGYDVESLFTNIPIKETIDFTWDKIYTRRKLKPICKQSIFKKLLCKLTTECTFSVTGRLRKQIDDVAMGGNLSVTLSDCLMNKMKKDCVIPLKPKSFWRYVD